MVRLWTEILKKRGKTIREPGSPCACTPDLTRSPHYRRCMRIKRVCPHCKGEQVGIVLF